MCKSYTRGNTWDNEKVINEKLEGLNKSISIKLIKQICMFR